MKFVIFPLAIANAATLAIIMSNLDVGLVAWAAYAIMLPVYFYGVRSLQDRYFKP